MKKKFLLFFFPLLLVLVLETFAQYTGSDIERTKPPTLYPEAGPGDLAIVEELKQTNRLLETQVALLTEQNRLLKSMNEKSNAQPAEKK